MKISPRVSGQKFNKCQANQSSVIFFQGADKVSCAFPFFAARTRRTKIWINLWGLSFTRRKIYPQKWWVLKRNWISKVRSCARGSETPCAIIHSFAATVTSTHSRDRSAYFLILLRSKSFPYLHPKHTTRRKMFFKLDALVVVPKALFLKWNFMSDCGIPFHHRVTSFEAVWTRTEKEKKKSGWSCGFELWSIFSIFFSKKFYFQRVAILLHFSRFSMASSKNPALTLIKINNLWIFPFIALHNALDARIFFFVIKVAGKIAATR